MRGVVKWGRNRSHHCAGEICDFVVNQQAVFLGGHYILQGSRNR